MSISLALLITTIVLMLLWLLIYATRKMVITAICRRALRRDDRNVVDHILNQARELAYLDPSDVFQIRKKLDLVKNGKHPARTKTYYLTAAVKRTFPFLFRRQQ